LVREDHAPGAAMTFGLVGDIIVGLFVTILVGAWLDNRKHGWKGRKKP